MTFWKKAVYSSDLSNCVLIVHKISKRSSRMSNAKQDVLMSNMPHSCCWVCAQIVCVLKFIPPTHGKI